MFANLIFRLMIAYICIALSVDQGPIPDNYMGHSPILTVTEVNSKLCWVLDDTNTVLSDARGDITEAARKCIPVEI